MHRFISTIALIVSLLCARLVAAEPPAAASGPAQDQVADPRVLTLPAITFLYKSVDADAATVGDRINETIAAVAKAAIEGKAHIIGSPVIVSHGANPDPKASYMLEVGFPVGAETMPVAGCKLKKLPEFRALSLLYSGRPTGLAAAYQKLWSSFPRGELKPTEESRQMIHYWESQDSPNNVIQVMVGIQ